MEYVCKGRTIPKILAFIIMTIEQVVGLIARLYRRLQAGKTGKPESLAAELGISERRLYRVVSSLRKEGIPIEYCRKEQTYRLVKPISNEFLVAAKQRETGLKHLTYPQREGHKAS